jgi:hypothetical protein
MGIELFRVYNRSVRRDLALARWGAVRCIDFEWVNQTIRRVKGHEVNKHAGPWVAPVYFETTSATEPAFRLSRPVNL